MYVDTASTRWMVRELGKTPRNSAEWIKKYRDRIIFGSDLSVGEKEADRRYWATRLWSQRVFWETMLIEQLPFKDEDEVNGSSNIKGLGLPQDTIDRIYYRNAYEFFAIR